MNKGTLTDKLLAPLLLVGLALMTSCVQENIPSGPVCNNLSSSSEPCADCDSRNSDHKACYDAFTHEVLPLLELRCIGCHSGGGLGEFSTGGEETGLVMDQDLAYARLLMPSFGDSGATRRIAPGFPDSSSLYNKITSTQPEIWFGTPMPGGTPLINTDPEAVETIRQWILNGAKAPAVSPPL
jgi:hypothetical protein